MPANKRMKSDIGAHVEPNMTSLLDVVLLLISFFVITVNFVRVDQINESIQLPVAQAAKPMDKGADNWIFLNMNSEGKLVGSHDMPNLNSVEKLRVYLKRRKLDFERVFDAQGRETLDVVVILRADKDAQYGDVWNVLETCTAAGYRKWQLRVLVDQEG